jgi:hypothetical protein
VQPNLTIVFLTAPEARGLIAEIKANLQSARGLLLDLYNGKGWIALGYPSWRKCVEAEFDLSQTHLYRELAAAQVELNISPVGEIGSIPERHCRELTGLPPELQKLAYDAATEHGPTTAEKLAAFARQLSPTELQNAIRQEDEAAAARRDESSARPLNVLRRLGNTERFFGRLEGLRPALVLRFGRSRWEFLVSEIAELERLEAEGEAA